MNIRAIVETAFCDYVPLFGMHDMIRYIRKTDGYKDLIGVEIGVNTGKHALNVLKVLSIKHLYLIDPYIETALYGDPAFRKRIALNNLKCFKDKISFLFLKSEDAINFIPDNVDFVYIDGDHNYNVVKKDIKLYYPKVKDGGVFGGEDFSPRNIGISKAVIEFVEKHNIRLLSSKDTDWWVCKI